MVLEPVARSEVIEIDDIPSGTPYATSLNGERFGVVVLDADTFQIWSYNPDTRFFDVPVQLDEGTYVGGGKIAVRDGFSITSKKFNFLDEGQNIQLGFLDILMQTTASGAISMNLYLDYNENTPVNQLNENNIPGTNPPVPDTFFNIVIPTTSPNPNVLQSSKYWQRAFCGIRGGFITVEYTLSNAQLIGEEQEQDVQIDAQVLYVRRAGRQLPIGV